MSTIDSRLRIEAALRGAKIAKAALVLTEDSVDTTIVRLVCQDLARQVLELEDFSKRIHTPSGVSR